MARRIDTAVASRLRADNPDWSLRRIARELGCDSGALSRALRREERQGSVDGGASPSYGVPAGEDPEARELMRERGFDPDKYVVVSATLGKWGNPDAPQEATRVHVKRIPDAAVISPAVPHPKLDRPSPAKRPADAPRIGFVASDFHAPYHDPGLFRCFLAFLEDVRPDFGVLNGDVLDLPRPSRHPRNPAFDASPQECVQAGYDIVAPVAARVPELSLVLGNHDERMRNWLLDRNPDLALLTPAIREDGEAQAPLISMRRLLHLDALGVEAIEPLGTYNDGEKVLARKLTARHGWESKKTAATSYLARFGHSLVFAHDHRKSQAWLTRWDWDGPETHTAVGAGTMARIEGGLGYTVKPDWHNGFAVVVLWPDGRFNVEHATYVADTLLWRDRRWEP